MARAAAILVLLSSSAWAQIEIPARVALGVPIVATLADTIPEGAAAAFDWQVDNASLITVDGGRTCHVWAKPGTHRINAVVAIGGADGLSVKRHDARFTVGDTPTPDPSGLADLVSTETAATLAVFHTDWAAAAGTVSSREVFDAAYQSTRANLKLLDTDAAYPAIDARLSIAGTGQTLVDALKTIAEEFGGDQPDTPPATGPRLAVIVRETENITPGLAGELVKLRTGTEADFLQRGKHQLAIIDDDAVDGDGQPAPILAKYATQIKTAGVPCLIIADAKTGKVLYAKPLPKDVTASNIIERIREVGG